MYNKRRLSAASPVAYHIQQQQQRASSVHRDRVIFRKQNFPVQQQQLQFANKYQLDDDDQVNISFDFMKFTIFGLISIRLMKGIIVISRTKFIILLD